jgi:outer membrane lipoprotein-sorting protein
MEEGNNMKKSLKKSINMCFFILLCPVWFFAGDVAADEPLSIVLDGIQKRYGDLNGMSVPYTREVITKTKAALGTDVKGDLAAGKILFMPPQYMTIQQEKPAKEIITTDGQTVWYYIAEKKLVYEYRAEDFGNVIRLLSQIFSGLTKVGDGFDVTQSDLGDNKEYHLMLTPNPAWQDVSYINLLVERKGFDIRVVEIHNIAGGITRFTMEALSVRKDLKKDAFRFKAPAGVQTVKQGQ